MKVGLFFGSFNPIHTGHLVIAEYLLEFSDLAEIWFVISPQNPLKDKDILASDEHRVNMLQLALPENNPRLKLCDIEIEMPRPSYTIDTLKKLSTNYPNDEFVVLMGSDSAKSINLWKDYQTLIDNWEIYVYPRENAAIFIKFPSEKFTLVDAPILGISSTQIRSLVEKGLNVSGYVPDDVWDYIKRNKLFGLKQTEICHE
ncbi:MAG: nicotinate (nicotinamide) nucleotide adenylyltransferase [Bacteroidales bacterium]